MSTPNFSYKNRCIVISAEDFEDGNIPEIQPLGFDRSYQQYTLPEYEDRLIFWQPVITSAYYEGASLDYQRRDNYAEDYFDLQHTYKYRTLAEFLDDLKTFDFRRFFLSWNAVKKHFSGLKKASKPLDEFIDERLDGLIELLAEQERSAANILLDKIKEGYGYEEIKCIALFSNGEAIYSRIDAPAA